MHKLNEILQYIREIKKVATVHGLNMSPIILDFSGWLQHTKVKTYWINVLVDNAMAKQIKNITKPMLLPISAEERVDTLIADITK